MIEHTLDYDDVDDLDDTSDDEQLVHIWCDTHDKYEWHWVKKELIA